MDSDIQMIFPVLDSVKYYAPFELWWNRKISLGGARETFLYGKANNWKWLRDKFLLGMSKCRTLQGASLVTNNGVKFWELMAFNLQFRKKSITQAQVSTIPAQGITKMKQRGILDYNFRCTFQKMMLYWWAIELAHFLEWIKL